MGRLAGLRALVKQLRHPGASLSMRVANAGIWAFLMRSTIRFAQIVRVIILGRLLSPSDFGLMAIATITLGLLEVLSQTGYRQALVQKRGEIEDSLDTAWSVELIRGLVVGAIVFLSAPLIASFYNQADVVSIVRAMSLVAIISGFTNMAIISFDRDLRFDLIFRFQVAQRMTEVVVAIAFALVWQSVWALVVGAIAGSVARVVASFLMCRRMPRFRIVRSQARALTQFGKWIYGTNALFYLTSEVDDILVGRMLGTSSLGLYRMAFTISQSVVTEIAQTINQVMYPTYSIIQESRARLSRALIQSTHLVAFMAFPVSALFVVLGEEIVLVLLGEEWLGLVSALEVLALAGAVGAITSLATIMFEGGGDPHLSTIYAALKLAVLAILILPLINRYGIVGAALASLLASLAIVIPVLGKVRSLSPHDFGKYLGALAWPTLNSLASAAIAWAVASVTSDSAPLTSLLLSGTAAVATYFGMVALSSSYMGYQQPRDLRSKLRNQSPGTPDDTAT